MYKTEFGYDSPIGRDRFCRIIDEYGLKVRLRQRKPRTTDSTHGLPTYPNLIKDFVPMAANQLWVSDITYIVVMDDECHYHFVYLSLIQDAYSEEIVGWCVGPTLDTDYPMAALKMALKRIEGKAVCLIHHSDRGCQYASREYTDTLKSHGILVSMTETGGMMTPAEASVLSGDREMKWTSYRQMAIKSRDNAGITEYPLPVPSCHGFPSGLRPPVNP